MRLTLQFNARWYLAMCLTVKKNSNVLEYMSIKSLYQCELYKKFNIQKLKHFFFSLIITYHIIITRNIFLVLEDYRSIENGMKVKTSSHVEKKKNS